MHKVRTRSSEVIRAIVNNGDYALRAIRFGETDSPNWLTITNAIDERLCFIVIRRCHGSEDVWRGVEVTGKCIKCGEQRCLRIGAAHSAIQQVSGSGGWRDRAKSSRKISGAACWRRTAAPHVLSIFARMNAD